MKRLFTLLAALMLMASASFAQQNFYFWEKNGNVTIEPMSQVDSLTFSVGDSLFQISKPVNLGVKTNAFKGSANVSINKSVSYINVCPEVGICYSDKNTQPTYDNNKFFLGKNIQNYSFTISGLQAGTTYFYRTYVKLLSDIFYSSVSSITTKVVEKPENKIINGHKFIDLGLFSGLLWAETNVGASVASESGDYFAWGETNSKLNYSWDTYKWGRISNAQQLSKYNVLDKKKNLDLDDDAVYTIWGKNCRIPSSLEFQELRDECDWLWVSDYNGSSGYLVTGANENQIFFPASGFYHIENVYSRGFLGSYWSSSLGPANTDCAEMLHFGDTVISISTSDYNGERCIGHTIRPVANK